MIIQGHPDILLGPRGLNGLHGFGSLPPEGSSPAYIRFLPEMGGAGIEALYQEIRDFFATNPTQAEIEQAKMASGVSDADIYKALENYVFPPVTDIFSPVITDDLLCAPGTVEVGGVCVSVGGAQQYDKTIDAVNAAKAASAQYVARLAAQGVAAPKRDIDTMELDFYYEFMAKAFPIVEEQPRGLDPIPDSSLRNREIVDYVTTHSDAEILAAMATTGVTQSDIIQAFASFDPTMPNGQSPAYARSLPENGGGGIANFYKEINDYVSAHSFYEVLSQMFLSEVSRADVEAANSYEFSKSPAGGGSGEAEALAAAEAAAEARRLADINALIESSREQQLREQEARAAAAAAADRAAAAAAADRAAAEAAKAAAAEAEARRIAALREENSKVVETGRQQAYLEAQAAAAEAAAQAAIAAQAAQTQQALEATLAARAAAAAAAAAQAVAAAVGDAASAAAAAKATAAANAAAATAATAAAIAVAKTPGQSAAYTRFLPQNGGKGITALYKEISDFVGTHSNAEIKTAMTASGVSEVDVIKALDVFPNKTTAQPVKDTGLVLPLVISAIAAFFVLG